MSAARLAGRIGSDVVLPGGGHDGRGRLVAALARALAELEEDLVLLHHAELRARALLDRLEAGLEIAHVGVERVVARLEPGVRLLLRRELPVEFAHLQPPALAEPHRILQRRDRAAMKARASQRTSIYLSWKNAPRPG